MDELVQKELGREELENFYVMVRSYYPNAVMGFETGVTGFAWLFGYDETERRVGVHNGSAMVICTESGTRYYVGVTHGRRTIRLCRTTSRKRFMGALKKLSSVDCGRNCTNMVTGGVEYTFLLDGAHIPDGFKIKDYYIVRLSNFTYRIFKKVQTETDRAVLRRWNAEGREYLNLSWIPKGWSPDGGSLRAIAEGGADQLVSGIRCDSSMAECKAEDGQILYALPNDFDCLGAAEENLRLVDGLLSKTGG